MAKVDIDKKKLNFIMVQGEGTMREVRKKAFKLKNEAREFYISQRKDPLRRHKHVDDGYADLFDVYRSGRSYIVTNTAHTAYWVEFGANIKPYGDQDADSLPVLGYAPLRTAIDIVSSYN